MATTATSIKSNKKLAGLKRDLLHDAGESVKKVKPVSMLRKMMRKTMKDKIKKSNTTTTMASSSPMPATVSVHRATTPQVRIAAFYIATADLTCAQAAALKRILTTGHTTFTVYGNEAIENPSNADIKSFVELVRDMPATLDGCAYNADLTFTFSDKFFSRDWRQLRGMRGKIVRGWRSWE